MEPHTGQRVRSVAEIRTGYPGGLSASDSDLISARAIQGTINDLLRHLEAYGQLTGEFLHIAPAQLALTPMRDELQRMIDALGKG